MRHISLGVCVPKMSISCSEKWGILLEDSKLAPIASLAGIRHLICQWLLSNFTELRVTLRADLFGAP